MLEGLATGHFRGVATVVLKLFTAVSQNRLLRDEGLPTAKSSEDGTGSQLEYRVCACPNVSRAGWAGDVFHVILILKSGRQRCAHVRSI